MKRIDVYEQNKRFPQLDPDDILLRLPRRLVCSFDWSLSEATENTLFLSWPIYEGNGLWHFKLEGLLIEL